MVESPAVRGPIFIGGLAHSGKTPLRLALSVHPELVLTRRTYMWNRYYNRYGDLGEPQNLERCLDAMLASKGIRALQPDRERIASAFRQGPFTYARLFALFHEQYAELLGKRRWGDQLGFVERFADPIFEAYPAAKMIQMIRDPRDRSEVARNHSRYRKGKVGWSTARWLRSAELTRRNQVRYPDRYKVVRYERLMAQPEETLREICSFLGERFLPEMAAEIVDERDRDGKGVADKQMDSRRMSKRDTAFVQKYAHHQLLGFDYPLEATNFNLSESILFYLIDWPANRAGMSAWQILRAETAKEFSEE